MNINAHSVREYHERVSGITRDVPPSPSARVVVHLPSGERVSYYLPRNGEPTRTGKRIVSTLLDDNGRSKPGQLAVRILIDLMSLLSDSDVRVYNGEQAHFTYWVKETNRISGPHLTVFEPGWNPIFDTYINDDADLSFFGQTADPSTFLKALHAKGREIYGPNGWDGARHAFALFVTGGRTSSSKDLTRSELRQILDLMDKVQVE